MNEEKQNVGRPTKLSDELLERIVKLLRAGNYVETACSAVGVNKTSYYSWLKRGNNELQRLKDNPNARVRKDEEPYVRFLNAVEEAQAQSEVRDLHRLDKHAEENPNVLMWRLERRFPERWGRRKIEADVHHSGNVKVNINVSSPDVDGDD